MQINERIDKCKRLVKKKQQTKDNPQEIRELLVQIRTLEWVLGD